MSKHLQDRDYTLILDRSGSMAQRDMPNGKSRWAEARESTYAVAAKCAEFDPDGITVYLFNSRPKRFDNTTPEKVLQLFDEYEPVGGTNLAGVLDDALGNYFQRKAAGQAKAQGEIFIVVTDGEPDDQRSVMKTIIEASRKLAHDKEIGISFLQIGNDAGATRFLKALDDELTRAGAKFDIVDTMTFDEMSDRSLKDVLLGALFD